MTSQLHSLHRTVIIQAPRETVFRFFTDSTRWASWWGAGSAVDARPGGDVRIRYPDGTEAFGQVVELKPPERFVFTFGFASGKPIPVGASKVTLTLEPAGSITRLQLSHEFQEASVRDEFVQGWRYQLSVFANVVADEVHTGAAAAIDAWFGAWSEPADGVRTAIFERIAAPNVTFRDRYSVLEGVADLVAHTGAAQRFMNVRLQRDGDLRHCQGMVLADWLAVAPDGQARSSGTNVFILGADGRIDSVTGFWSR